MANQMIALGVRGPQLPNLAGAAAQYGNMMANMATMKEKQAGVQRANAFRQLVSDPGFDPANPEHIKAAQSLDPVGAEKIVSAADARRKANLEYIGQLTQQFREELAVIDPSDKAAYGALREEIVNAVPGWGSRLPTAEQWGPDARVRTLMKADDVISKTIPTPTASVQFAPGGEAYGVTVGGLGPPTAQEVTVIPQGAAPPVGMAPAPTPQQQMSSAGVNARATRGAQTTPQDLLGQGVDPKSIPSGNPLDPVAFTPGGEAMGVAAVQPLTVENAPQIIQTAVQNGVIDQSHVEQLRQIVGPETDAALANWMRQNNVRIQPAGEPSMRSAVYRPGQNEPSFQQVQQTLNAPGTQFRGRDPMQSPMPGSAVVPIERVRQEAEAGRETPEQAARRRQLERQAEGETAYLIELEKGRGAADADFLNRYESSAAEVRKNIALLNQMLGAARVEGLNVIGSAAPGFKDVVGVGIPGLRFIPGTAAADFDALHQQVMGSAFLDAFENLKGGGPISDREGQAATSARTRLGRNISEREYIKAATELRDAMQGTLDRADRRYSRITQQAPEGRAPAAPPRTTRSGARVRDWTGGR